MVARRASGPGWAGPLSLVVRRPTFGGGVTVNSLVLLIGIIAFLPILVLLYWKIAGFPCAGANCRRQKRWRSIQRIGPTTSHGEVMMALVFVTLFGPVMVTFLLSASSLARVIV